MIAAATIDTTVESPIRRADRTTTVRPGRRRDSVTGPSARPVLFAPAPAARIPAVSGPHGCQAEAAVVIAPLVSPSTWRLTDRGIAVALVAMLMIVVAALTVIGLTALRVTGESYAQPGQISRSQAQLAPSAAVGSTAARSTLTR